MKHGSLPTSNTRELYQKTTPRMPVKRHIEAWKKKCDKGLYLHDEGLLYSL